MKILCCLNEDVVSNVALNLLLPSLAGHDVRIVVSERVGSGRSSVEEPRQRIELRFAEQGLPRDVVFPSIERAAYEDRDRYLTFAEIQRIRGLAVERVSNPNAGDGLAVLERFAPDLIVSIRYGAIFKAPAIAIPRRGILNLHAGVLPAYRGVLATFRALMNDEPEIGCTLHYITDGTIDTGPVVDRALVVVDRTRSMFWNVLSLYPSGVALIADAIARLHRGETLRTSTQSGGTYFSYPRADEWDEFNRRGWRVVDLSDLHEVFARFLPASLR